MDFAYYIVDAGSESDRKKNRHDMLRLADLGYLGFDDVPGCRTIMYRPFRLGVHVPGPHGKSHPNRSAFAVC